MGLLSPAYAGVVYLYKEPHLQYSTRQSRRPISRRIVMKVVKENKEKTALQLEYDAHVTAQGSKSDRDSIYGLEKRSAERKAINEIIEAAEKDAKGEGVKKGELKTQLKVLRRIRREYGHMDGATFLSMAVNIAMTAGGGAISAKMTDGRYLHAIIPNLVGCLTVDAATALIEKNFTGQFDEGWKRITFQTVIVITRVGGAAGIAAGTSYLMKGDPLTAAITAVGTQTVKIVFEKLADMIIAY